MRALVRRIHVRSGSRSAVSFRCCASADGYGQCVGIGAGGACYGGMRNLGNNHQWVRGQLGQPNLCALSAPRRTWIDVLSLDMQGTTGEAITFTIDNAADR